MIGARFGQPLTRTTLTDTIKEELSRELNACANSIADTLAPPESVTARSLLGNQLSVKMLEHMKWLIDSNYTKPDKYASKNKRFTLMGETDDDENYSIWLRAEAPQLVESKAYKMVCNFELSKLVTRIYCEHPNWKALYDWRDACAKQLAEHRALLSAVRSNMVFINTTGQLNRCLPTLTSMLPETRERASRKASVRSPIPQALKGNEVQLYRLDRDLSLMLAKHRLTKNIPTSFWVYG